ncbi:MAG: DNA mismatch repair endonuclease MutL [Thermoplasmata archaeon]
MTNKINILPETISAKIAAGEVVERPASVVKELVENSIDAGARKIIVDLIDSGKLSIIVKDDGEGMSREDCLKAIEKHATSKIKSEEDLNNISTLGFRGEALYSIASVSKMIIVTKREEDQVGTMVEIEAGKILNVKEVGTTNGTTVTVNNLFYNLPARKKFLKSNLVELDHIYDLLFRLAISHPEIALKFTNNQKILIDVPASEKLMDKLNYLFSLKEVQSFLSVDFKNNNIRIEGVTSLPSMTRKTNKNIILSVNRRIIRENNIIDAILKGYGSLLFRDLYPVTILNLTVPYDQVDVNIHPAKTEIKFSEETLLKKYVTEAISQALKQKDLIPAMKFNKPETLEFTAPIQPIKAQQIFQTTEPKKIKTLEESVPKMLEIEPFGQIDNTYIIASFKENMLIIDQHAAHERIRTEAFIKGVKDKKIQSLITPITLTLNNMELEIVMNNIQIFKDIGFDIDKIGKNEILIRTLPPILTREDAIAGLKESIREVLSNKKITNIEELKLKLMILMACKGAIKAHQKLSTKDMADLIYKLMQCDVPFTCPHGRPTMIKIENSDLEKMFKRKD